MRIMISGSIAYDNILSYPGRFSEHLVRESLDHINLTFVTESLTRNYGGCAANIAYALNLLGGEPVVTGAVGTDGADYLYRFEQLGIETSVRKFNDVFTAQCFVTTDATGSQIATFNPGAMQRAHEAPFPEGEIGLALVAPDGKQAVIQRINEAFSRNIPVIFDIGQAVSILSGEEIREIISKCTYLAASAYELELIERATNLSEDQIAGLVKALIVTYGEKGSTVRTEGKTIKVAACRVEIAVDPVGAGDAYRGGLLYGLSKGWDWQETLRLASVMGSFSVERTGGQNYAPSKEKIAARYQAAFGVAMPE